MRLSQAPLSDTTRQCVRIKQFLNRKVNSTSQSTEFAEGVRCANFSKLRATLLFVDNDSSEK